MDVTSEVRMTPQQITYIIARADWFPTDYPLETLTLDDFDLDDLHTDTHNIPPQIPDEIWASRDFAINNDNIEDLYCVPSTPRQPHPSQNTTPNVVPLNPSPQSNPKEQER